MLKVNFGTADFRCGTVAIQKGFCDRSEVICGGGLKADATGSECGEMGLPNFDRDKGFNDTGDTGDCLRFRKFGVLGDDFQAQRQAREGVKGVMIVLEKLAIGQILDESATTGGLGLTV